MIITRTGDNTWKVGRSDEHRYPYNCTVTYAGKSDDGKNVFTVETYNTDESTISQYSETVVKAIMTTQEGSMTIIDPQPKHYEYYWDDEGFPEGSGLFRIDTEMHGKPLDWAELRYDPSGKKLEFNSNL